MGPLLRLTSIIMHAAAREVKEVGGEWFGSARRRLSPGTARRTMAGGMNRGDGVVTMPTIFANGRRLYYEEFGKGDPVAFLSGLGGDHRAFAVSVRALAGRFRAMALDHRDVGRSDRAEGDYTIADMAEDVAAWFDTLDLPPVHVVGQSLGGLVAQELAIRRPEKVRSLTLVSTHAGTSAWKKAVIESWVAIKRLSDPAGFTRATLPWLVAPGFYKNEALIEGLIRFADRNEWPQQPEAFERQARAAVGYKAHDGLRTLGIPTLVLVGELDIVNPPDVARDLADRIPGARFEVIPGVGHLPHVEDNATFRKMVEDFIGR